MQDKASTLTLWQGVHRVQDIKPSISTEDHLIRVLTRENTPWVANDILNSNSSDKHIDPYIAKYWPLVQSQKKDEQMIS